MDEEEKLTRADFDNWFEYIDYIAYSDCMACRTGRFYVLLGVILALVLNIGFELWL